MKINVLEYLEQTAARLPQKTAFFDDKEKISYAQLLKAAKSAGAYIAKITPPRRPVVIIMEKSVYMPAMFFAAVYAGCFYVPVDAGLPLQRLNIILDVVKPEIIVTDAKNSGLVDKLGFSGKKLLSHELIKEAGDDKLLADRRRQALDTDPLYVVFTSGSTGIPKGVITAHKSVIDLVENMTADFGIEESDVMGNQAPFDYDGSVKDIYNAIKVGASVYIIPRVNFSFPKNLIDSLNNNKVTTIFWAVSAMCVPVNLGAFEYGRPKYLKRILFSGAVMPCKSLRVWQDNCPGAMFVNLFGPTETTCNCTYYVVKQKVDAGDVLPIGKPYRNTGIILLKDDGSEAAQGETAQICVTGTCLALGYYNNPEKTQEAFVRNPLNKAYYEPLYKTGDLGEYTCDGLLIFHGRRDFQIKHMGHRIELGEIETAVSSMESIDECCCLYNSPKSEITLFYTGSATSKDIAIKLRSCLPKFMLPGKFVLLQEMPKQLNGKINRVGLSERYFNNEEN